MKRLICRRRPLAVALLAGQAQADTTLQLTEVITSPQRTELLKGMIAKFEAANPGREGRGHLAALGPGVREAGDHGPGRPDPRRGRDARALAVALRQQRPAREPEALDGPSGPRPRS